MQAPKIPSFFKTQKAKSFNFNPRYYNEREERKKNLKNDIKSSLRFNRTKVYYKREKGRSYKILLLIIVLSLLAYKLLIS